MRIHVGNAELVPELIGYFEAQSDCVVLQVGEREIEVSLLGSYRGDRHDVAVERKLALFWARTNGGHRTVAVRPTNGHSKPQPGPAPA